MESNGDCYLDPVSWLGYVRLINKALNGVKSSMHDIGLSTKLYFKILKDMQCYIWIPQI